MVEQVGLNQGLANNYYPTVTAPLNNPITVNNNTNSLFNASTPSVNDYSGDFMMQNLDFNAMAAGVSPQTNNGQIPQMPVQNQPQVPQTPVTVQNQPISQQTNSSFNGNNNVNTSELDNCLTQRDPNIAQTENGNPYRKTYTLTKTGAVAGLAAPIAVKGFELFKAGALKNIFKSKSLLVSCPLVAAAGLGIGWLLDGFLNSKRAQKVDGTVQPQPQPQPQSQSQVQPQAQLQAKA